MKVPCTDTYVKLEFELESLRNTRNQVDVLEQIQIDENQQRTVSNFSLY